MKDVRWVAVASVVLLFAGLLCGGIAFWLGNWDTFAFAGVLELAGIGLALLNLNDKE